MKHMISIIVGVLLYALFFGAFFWFYRTKVQVTALRRRFFRALVTILKKDDDNASKEEQLNLNFKKLAENYPRAASQFRGTTDLIEDLIHFFDAGGPEMLDKVFETEAEETTRDGAYSLLRYIRDNNPFTSLPTREASLLQNLQDAVDKQNKELGLATLRQLAERIEVLDSTVRAKDRAAKVAFLISVLGVILTIVFGLLSFVQVIAG